MAQPVIQSTDLSLPFGTEVTIHSTDYHAAGPATNNFVLDLSNLTIGPASSSVVLDPSTTPYGSYFPDATYSSTAMVNQQNYSYTQVTSTVENVLGVYGPDLQIIYTNPQQVGKFPLSLGTNWNDSFSGTQTVSGIVVDRSGTSTGNYNGYGTVILPFGTFNNVARVEMTQSYTDTYMGFSYNTVIHEVGYLLPGLATSLYSTNSTVSDIGGSMDTLATGSFVIDPAAVGIHENNRPIAAILSPNPAINATSLLLTGNASPGLAVSVFDATGRLVRSVPVAGGEQRLTIDVAGLRPGLYVVRATDEDGAMGRWPLTVE
jgi:hypothetical protein